ncbi:hypothetical protein MN116_007828 [Schistosoma mekongi]|uniref:SCP domain-containing protein n=1 Tax=Schistosoma mekongi TaxID=38744 RepID=A0AAE2D2D7_SCHME|nr:hypothetical protein MN116_007828 [Schistosoma mekongi]
MDQRTRVRLLTLHNNVRKSVVLGWLAGQPIVIKMNPLVWDKELESKAQILANNCSFVHDNVTNRRTSSFAYVGQNIAGASNVDIVNQTFHQRKVNLMRKYYVINPNRLRTYIYVGRYHHPNRVRQVKTYAIQRRWK